MSTFYWCNGGNPFCNHCEGCYLNGGDCKHTTHIEYALTEPCDKPWLYPERFEPVVVQNCPTYYFERAVEENEEEIFEENFEPEDDDEGE